MDSKFKSAKMCISKRSGRCDCSEVCYISVVVSTK